MTRWIEADEIAGFLEPGMTIFVAGGTAEPRDSLDVLERYPERCAGIRFVSVSIPGINLQKISVAPDGTGVDVDIKIDGRAHDFDLERKREADDLPVVRRMKEHEVSR